MNTQSTSGDIVLELVKFSTSQAEISYKLLHFTEDGKNFTVLSENGPFNRVPSGTRYKFGLKDKEGNYFWFFDGIPTVKSREKAIITFGMLKTYCDANDLGEPFFYKAKAQY